MKSKFLRILALILVMSSLISMFAIFAGAEEASDGEAEGGESTENTFQLMYHRTYDEGWDIFNGLGLQRNNAGAENNTTFEIDHETTIQGKYNYFWRMTVGDETAHQFLQLEGAQTNVVGSVIEFDFMADDVTSIANPVIFNTKGEATTDRYAANIMKIENNNVYLMQSSTPTFTIEANEWTRIQLILDYTYEPTEAEIAALEGNTVAQYFRFYVKYGPADGSEPLKLLNDEPLICLAPSGNGIKLIRFQTSAADFPAGKENHSGNSICFDNVKYYEGVNEIVPLTKDMGHGLKINEQYPITEDILGGSDVAGSASDISAALSMKVGVDYCYLNRERVAIFEKDGVAYGAPVKVDGKVMVPLLTVLKYIGYEASIHPDEVYIDVPTGLTPAVHLKVGKNEAYMGGETIALDAAPGYITVGQDADGNDISYLVIALSDIEKLFEGYYSDYDDMGYMIVGKYPDMLDRDENLASMITIMKKFIFDYYDGERIYNDVLANTNFEHPYLLANGDQIEMIRNEYQQLQAEYEAGTLVEGTERYWMWYNYYRIVSDGEGYYTYYSKTDANGGYDTYAGLMSDDEYFEKYNKPRGTKSLEQNYMNAGGYDAGGRSDISNRTGALESMAYSYVLTLDDKYLQASYDIAVKLGTWTHWGPGHFLNCADSSNDFAIYYDWTYQGYVSLAERGVKRIDENGAEVDYDVAVLAEILARQGVHEGYLSTKGQCDHVSPPIGIGGSSYSQRTNNWAAVCVGGMTVASLAILDGHAGEDYVNEAKYILGENLKSLLELGMDIYAPDGAYVEGPGYWNYGTNNFFRMCAALDSATGTNYGLMDCWGIDTTCYYACHTEDNNSKFFPYHDGTVGSQDTSYFFYVANYFNDATLYDARLGQITSPYKRATPIDMIYYPRDIEINADDIQLDYYSSNIDLFATRSSWEEDALFASMIGGKNKVSHGQIDAGDFVYHNGGNIWIYDLGTENYNAAGFWPDETRYRYYRMKPEGNNTVAISSDTAVPYGQLLTAEAKAYAWGGNEYGSYVTYDMGNALGANVRKWERGMLLTNDRKTTVIQDQISFRNAQTVYWFAHYSLDNVKNVLLSDDGRTAYLRRYMGSDEHGQPIYQTLRLAIVSANKTLKFQMMTTYQFIHNDKNTGTYTPDEVIALGGDSEKSRSNFRKLAISSGEALGFEVAVVIELIDDATIGKSTELEIGYEFQSMSSWEPSADKRGIEVDDGDTIVRRGIPNIKLHIEDSLTKIQDMEAKGTLYAGKIKDYYRALTDSYYAIKMIGSDMPADYADQVAKLNQYRKDFTAYRNAIVKLQKDQGEFVYKLMGLV